MARDPESLSGEKCKFSDDSITVHVIPLIPSKTPAPRPRIPSTPSPATIEDVPDEDDQPQFEYDDNGESEIEVEGELQSTTPTPAQTPGRRVTPQPTTQPTWQSSHIRKPSAKVRQIQAGEGSPDGGPGSFTSEQLTSIASRKEKAHAYLASLDNEGHDPLGDPRTVKEAMASPDWLMWKAATDSEIQSLQNAKTWRKTACPAHRKVVGNQWVFRKKRKADRSIEKYKARLVARGFTQILGLDYTKTYAPVACMVSFRTILTLAAQQDWEVDAFNFNSAYLNGKLGENEEIYMEELPGYETPREDSVVCLQKAIYRLKQAGRKWYDALSRILTDIGFSVSGVDLGVFVAREGRHILILAAHVNDCVITGSSPELIKDFKIKLNDCYALTDLGPVQWLLGIKVTRNREACTISLSQEGYIALILEWFSLQDAKAVDTPMLLSVSYSKRDCPANDTECKHMARVPYREAIRSLMYASVATRPDITFAVSTLSQFLNNPGEAHWEAIKRGLPLQYLSGMRDLVLTYGGDKHKLQGHTDADGALQRHRHAISRYCYSIDGGAVSWSSKKQELVMLSTAEAEYVAAMHASKEAIWLRHLIGDLVSHSDNSTTLLCDNQSAVHLAHSNNYHARMKHINIWYHFIRDIIERGEIELLYCLTDDMTADIFTKALTHFKVFKHVHSLGLCHP